MAIRLPEYAIYTGNTAAATHRAPSVDHQAGDLLLIWVSQANSSAAPSATTQAGWTKEEENSFDKVTGTLFTKRAASSSETWPLITLSGTNECGLISCVVPDVPVSFVGNKSAKTENNNSPFNSVTTTDDNSYVLYFFSVNRRGSPSWQAFDTNGTANTVAGPSGNTGSSANVDTGYASVWDFAAASGSTLDPIRQSSNNEDSVKLTIEIKSNGNHIPALFTGFPFGAAITGYSQGTSDAWRDAFVASGYTFAGAQNTRTFDASSDVNTTTNEITIPAHGYDEAWVVKLEANGDTPPPELIDGAYYWVRPVDADRIRLVDCEGDIDSASEYYCDGSVLKTEVNLSAVGSGTITLRDAGCVFSNSGDNLGRWNDGSSANVGAFSGDYNGNSVGAPRVLIGYSREFTTPRDMSAETIYFGLRYGTGDYDMNEQGVMLIDSNNEWRAINMLENSAVSVDFFGNGTRPTLLQPAQDFSSNTRYYESGGSFDASSVKHKVFYCSDINSLSIANSNNSMSDPIIWDGVTVFGGSIANPITMDDIANAIASRLVDYFADRPARDQFTVFRIPFTIGGSGLTTHFSENVRALAVPTLGDSRLDCRIFLRDFSITYNLQSGDTFTQTSTLQGATNFLVKETHTIDAGATVAFNGRVFSGFTPTLDADVTYIRPSFVGCNFIVDNGAAIPGGSFTVTDLVGADNGLINWDASTNITGGSFDADGLTDGHAIIVTDPNVTINWTNQDSGFGVDESNTATIYNDSGTLLTVNVSGAEASTPTIRNGPGSTSQINAGASVTLTGLIAGSEVRAYDGTDPATATVVDGTESSGTTFSFTHSIAGNSGFIVIRNTGYDFIKLGITYSATNQNIPIQQRVDRYYENP